MPPLPTIADVYRLALLWQTAIGGGGRHAVNVLHVRSVGNTALQVGTDFGDALESVVEDNNPFALLDGDYVLTSIEVLKLDGASAAVATPVSGVSGGATGDSIPNMANVVSFKTAQRGSRGRGRIYIGPTTEGENLDGFLSGSESEATAVADNWLAFHVALRAKSPSLDPVVASYEHADAHSITSVRCNFKMGTQRRRLQRL